MLNRRVAGCGSAGDDLKRVSGWEFKPQGFCKGEVCVPVPAARKSEFVAGDRYNLAALANLLGQPVVIGRGASMHGASARLPRRENAC